MVFILIKSKLYIYYFPKKMGFVSNKKTQTGKCWESRLLFMTLIDGPSINCLNASEWILIQDAIEFISLYLV